MSRGVYEYLVKGDFKNYLLTHPFTDAPGAMEVLSPAQPSQNLDWWQQPLFPESYMRAQIEIPTAIQISGAFRHYQHDIFLDTIRFRVLHLISGIR